MSKSAGRKGRPWRAMKDALKARRLPCHLCGQPIAYDAPPNDPESFEADHYYPVSTHPHLANDPANLRASHSRCNRSRGNQAAQTGTWATAEDW